MNKKIHTKKSGKISLIIALILVISTIFIGLLPVSANQPNNDGIITVSSTSGKAGTEVSVTVRIDDNPGMASYKLSMWYNKNKLEYIGTNPETAVGDGGIIPISQLNPADSESKGRVLVMGLNTKNVTADGLLFTLRFKIKDGTPSGDITGTDDLFLTYNGKSDITNESGVKLNPLVVQGKITVNQPNNDGIITVSSASGKAGTEVSVTVRIDDNPGMASYKLSMWYNKNKLEYIGTNPETAIGDGGIIPINQLNPADSEGKGRVLVIGLNTKNVTADGLLFTLRFKIKDGTPNGDITGTDDLFLTYNGKLDITNESGVKLNPLVVQGKITVGPGASEPELEDIFKEPPSNVAFEKVGDNTFIKGIEAGNEISNLKFADDVKIYDQNGEDITGEEINLSTGMQIAKGTEEIIIVVIKGDLTGRGTPDITDAKVLLESLVGNTTLTPAQMLAAKGYINNGESAIKQLRAFLNSLKTP